MAAAEEINADMLGRGSLAGAAIDFGLAKP